MTYLLYHILRGFTWLNHFLPLRVHYAFSDFLFFLVYRVFGYRRKVVQTNLANAFPEKTEQERKKIERQFYRHFCDSFIETLYFSQISPSRIKKRMKFLNPELAEKYLDEGRQVIVSMGHHNNWEWMCSWGLHTKTEFYVVYKPLHNKSIDRFYYKLRSRFNAIPLEKNKTFRQLVSDKNENKVAAAGFLNDQTPKKNEIQYWTTFLNQETPILLGTEKIAKKVDAVVLGAHMQKQKRGHYTLTFHLITDKPKETAQYEITEKHTRFLEQIIKDEPAYWLWSHRRWKHKREPENTESTGK
ncbi:lysophospholipid acyltransferase family protein [Prolixibacter denitrificans]|uniref:Acetyltransferase n=1 Tax=Prolixibacter denitrificans TaxID=1541063 RepID=A0A2P8C942_9BACT|nr:lysophospholipid acyltransferase family protein [Prolixibacter denitrificans]PSK81471.1 KDO2-lipid IV(A) lauroyltransferase [Prolixibacter denitrificans]GET21059.1 acetyltransferase [Prolixibacter denitrificans]